MSLEVAKDIKQSWNDELKRIREGERRIKKAKKLFKQNTIFLEMKLTKIIGISFCLLSIWIIMMLATLQFFGFIEEPKIVRVPEVQIIKEQPIIENHYFVSEVMKNTTINYQINATKGMVCLGVPGERSVTCYKEQK